MRNLLPLPIVLLLSFLMCSVQAQDATKTYTVKTNLLVVDDKGDPVNGLHDSDIKVFEAGVEKSVQSLKMFDSGVDLSILVDNSGSVRKQLPQVVAIAKTIVADLRPGDRATVIRFVGRDHIEIVQPWTEKKNDLSSVLDDLYVEGGQTAAIDALYLATQNLVANKLQGNRRQAIVLISDGEDRDSYYTEKQLFQALAKTDIQAFSITVTKDLPQNYWELTPGRMTSSQVARFVNRLAAVTGGTSYLIQDAVKDKKELGAALKGLQDELRSQYMLTYNSTGLTKQNNLRNFRIEVANGPQGEIRHPITKTTIFTTPD